MWIASKHYDLPETNLMSLVVFRIPPESFFGGNNDLKEKKARFHTVICESSTLDYKTPEKHQNCRDSWFLLTSELCIVTGVLPTCTNLTHPQVFNINNYHRSSFINLIWGWDEILRTHKSALKRLHWSKNMRGYSGKWQRYFQTWISMNVSYRVHRCDLTSQEFPQLQSYRGAHVRAFRCLFSPSGSVEHHNEEHCVFSSHVCPSWVSRCCPWPRSDCGTGEADSF